MTTDDEKIAIYVQSHEVASQMQEAISPILKEVGGSVAVVAQMMLVVTTVILIREDISSDDASRMMKSHCLPRLLGVIGKAMDDEITKILEEFQSQDQQQIRRN